MKKKLSIGITSYNRLRELERCVNSIKTEYNEKIEVIISEDKSPLKIEIELMVNDLKKIKEFDIVFNSNKINLGYDGNLEKIIELSSGEYVLLMSDDDILTENAIDSILNSIESGCADGLILSPYIHFPNGNIARKHSKSKKISCGSKSVKKYIYDFILFSGLIFKREYVKNISAAPFKNYNYFQVYLASLVLYKYGGYYLDAPTIICIGDGENAYGVAESSGGNEILANRKSVISNLEFNKTLIKTIKKFDNDYNTEIIKSFQIQYSFHSFSGLSIARNNGRLYFKKYWYTLNSLDIHLSKIVHVYYFLLNLFGSEKTVFILSVFAKIRIKYRALHG